MPWTYSKCSYYYKCICKSLIDKCLPFCGMSGNCKNCDTAISRTKPGVSCTGFCSSTFHCSCVGIPSDVLKYMKTTGLFWYCENCVALKNDYENCIKNIIEDKVNGMIKNIKELFVQAKTEIVNAASDRLNVIHSKINEVKQPILYSQAASSKRSIIIKPKNISQTNAQTKIDIVSNINPVDSNINISKIKNVRNGGILIGCSNVEGAKNFKKLASQKLSENYEVKELKNVNPRLKIVGMSEKYSEEQLLLFLKSQNNVMCENSVCKVLKVWPTKKCSDVYQAIVELDGETYCRVLNTGNLFVNFDNCIIYEALDLKICYKCSGLNHVQKFCNATIACPKCSLNHCISDCNSSNLRCINCVNAKLDDCNHAALDTSKCPTYKQKLEQYKSSLFMAK